MMDNENSYVRTRGILLIAENAKWDCENRIDEIIDEYLKHITDVKPITARQCIQALPKLAKYKPDLREVIREALLKAHVGRYYESMKITRIASAIWSRMIHICGSGSVLLRTE